MLSIRNLVCSVYPIRLCAEQNHENNWGFLGQILYLNELWALN